MPIPIGGSAQQPAASSQQGEMGPVHLRTDAWMGVV
jgi:hypothetical protein